ncbi:MAG TPA: HIT family protein [Candidatus Paceibacterota bacterium]
MQAGENNCVFCKIIRGEIPDYRFWENDHAIAFLGIEPKVPGHSLVVPKQHVPYIFDMTDQNLSELMSATKIVAGKLKKFTGKDRVCVIVEGFAVPHVHVHLIPADNPEEFMSPALPGDKTVLADLQAKLKSD